MKINIEAIRSIGWLHNHNQTISLSICLCSHNFPILVTISRKEFDDVGRIDGLNANKQKAIDFYKRYGAGRPE